MHWVKLLVEVWGLFGLVSVIFGLFWTSKLNTETQHNAANRTASSTCRAEIAATGLTGFHSA